MVEAGIGRDTMNPQLKNSVMVKLVQMSKPISYQHIIFFFSQQLTHNKRNIRIINNYFWIIILIVSAIS